MEHEMKKFRSSLRFDPFAWDKTFKEEKNNLLYYLSNFKVAIKHIGATAYTGGMSNRNVDILVTTTSFEDISSVQVRLQSKGYKLIPTDRTDMVLLTGPKRINGYGVSIRIMEYASNIYNRFSAFETLLKEDHKRVTAYNKYRDEINIRCDRDFPKYQELKFNYINALIDEKFKFE